ncbi:DUF1800 domain-containing protein [Pedobacter sp. JY14-1]|uniref:DUF1800 domain-containing protein n=1 Tax=Pedobacter sp. JY14-1 TaxID=3034151 RepID=UPI0023E2D5C9|nr:DUF1800 domain-containing protein [Pedobacter sp. JY14-1]
MKTFLNVCGLSMVLFCAALFFSSFNSNYGNNHAVLAFPYRHAGLTDRQAAAHLLSRFTYGAEKGEVDEVLKTGLEKWFTQQLKGGLEDRQLDTLLAGYEDINLSNAEVEERFPGNAKVLRMAIRDGGISKDSVNKGDQKAYRAQLQEYRRENGLKPQQELYRQFINQKILRAVYTRNQLREILTDFWFNHFNVSLTKNQCASFVPAFERDVIRPNVTGKFGDLLLATAKSPAMLTYLDNFTSSGGQAGIKPDKPKKSGLNENYAREVMELHTLGVDGGYSQNDVTQAARVLTGWTIAPASKEFLFTPRRHDQGEKVVLGHQFSAGGGYEEGVELLALLARHPATAMFISHKLAVRFVNDAPSPKLINKMARTFTQSGGDIAQVLMTMVSEPEFWDRAALREKTKSPFELVISAVRSLDAKITQPYQLFSWINKMGQKIYYYQAPTGFPDRGQYWINTGSLLSRMNFGLALATQRIPGVHIDLKALNNNREPESADSALLIYSRLIMPERNLTETMKRLKPMLSNPGLANRLQQAAEKNVVAGQDKDKMQKTELPVVNENMLAQVVGVIIGSPEFQRK